MKPVIIVRKQVLFSTAMSIAALLPSLSQADDRQALAAQERAFAARAQVIGQRSAFIEYFAADGMALESRPISVPQEYAKRQDTPGSLNWAPQWASTSAAGDLGFDSGPWTFKNADGVTVANGYFCSVWQKQDGRWQVIYDAGGSNSAQPLPDDIDDDYARSTPALPDKKTKLPVFDLQNYFAASGKLLINAVAEDALWQAPQTTALRGKAGLVLLDKRNGKWQNDFHWLAASGDFAVSVQHSSDAKTVHYLTTVWQLRNPQWQLQSACFADVPLTDLTGKTQ